MDKGLIVLWLKSIGNWTATEGRIDRACSVPVLPAKGPETWKINPPRQCATKTRGLSASLVSAAIVSNLENYYHVPFWHVFRTLVHQADHESCQILYFLYSKTRRRSKVPHIRRSNTSLGNFEARRLFGQKTVPSKDVQFLRPISKPGTRTILHNRIYTTYKKIVH